MAAVDCQFSCLAATRPLRAADAPREVGVGRRLAAEQFQVDVAIDPRGSPLYVTLGTGDLAVVSPEQLATLATVTISGAPRGLALSPAGLYGYVYPGANLDHASPHLGSRSLDTLEANLSLSWKSWTLKYSRAMTDYFGADVEQGYRGSTRGTQYLQLDGSIALGKQWSLAPHLGYTDYRRGLQTPLANGARDPGYADYGLALKYAPNDSFAVSLGVTHASNDAFYAHVASFRDPADVRDLGGTRVVFSLSTTF